MAWQSVDLLFKAKAMHRSQMYCDARAMHRCVTYCKARAMHDKDRPSTETARHGICIATNGNGKAAIFGEMRCHGKA